MGAVKYFAETPFGDYEQVTISCAVLGYEITVTGSIRFGEQFKPRVLSGSFRVLNILEDLSVTCLACKEAILAHNVEGTFRNGGRKFWLLDDFKEVVRMQVLTQLRAELAPMVSAGYSLEFDTVSVTSNDPVDTRNMHTICQEMFTQYLSEVQELHGD